MTAALVGYDPARADGVFTFGGTGTLLYGAKIGLEKAVPGVRRDGLRTPAVIVCSDARPLRVPDRRQLARPRRGAPDQGRRDRRPPDAPRRAGARAARPRRGRHADRVHRRHDGHDRCVRPRRPRRHREAARRAGRGARPRLRAARARRRRHRLGVERVQRLRLRRQPARLPPSHRARDRRHGAADPAPRPRRLDRHRLPQDRLRAVHLERRARARRPRLPPPGAQRRGHALHLPVGRAASRPVHARDDARRATASSPRWPTCGCSAGTGCRRSSATSSRWRRRCASTSKATSRRRC